MPAFIRRCIPFSWLLTLTLALGGCAVPPAPAPTTASPSTAAIEPSATLPPPTSTPEAAPPPDSIFHNGTILTMDQALPLGQAIAIQGERVLAVGNEVQILAMRGLETQVVDLGGRTLMPGFVDAHTHLLNDAWRMGLDLEGAQELALRIGITTLADAYVTPAFLEEMRRFDADGRLRVRTSLYLVVSDNCGVLQGDWYLDHPPTREPGEMLRIGGVKIFADGGSCGRPALSYVAPGADGLGDLWFSQEGLTAAVTEADRAGYQVVIHALGDRAVEQAQNALAAVLDGGPNTLRHRIDHNAVIRPDLMARYGELGIVTVIFGAYPLCSPRDLPAPYRDWEWPWRQLLDANPGLHVAWQGDDPWLPPVSPILDLYGLVTRRATTPDGSAPCDLPSWLADDAITVEQALPLMTAGSAYALFREEEVGSLEPGKFADLILLSANPQAVDPEALRDLQVLMTMVGGRVEFCLPGSETLCPQPGSPAAGG